METKDIIYSIVDSQPEGRELLNIIKVDFSQVQDQYYNCNYLQRVVEIKFDINKLKSDGYTLKELLDISEGILAIEGGEFVLHTLRKFLAARTPRPDQNNTTQ